MSYSVIITASFVKSHPSIEFMKCTIESLQHIGIGKDTSVLLAHDYHNNSIYRQYLNNLSEYIADKPNMQIIVRDSHGHLTGNIRNVFKFVNTEYVLILQHDLPFVRSFEIDKVIADIQSNPEMKHVRFNKRANVKTASDALNNLFGKQLKSLNYTYTRTPSWSDQNHLCRSDYYRDIILNECDDGKFMENYLMRNSINATIHNKYGTYIFGELNSPAYIHHTDSRNKLKLSM